ncbi:hypothetical protein B0H14DRAFT_3471464 [Mycena olivaceomarginata]|nr:hypothetical protein B0H14DRAFT_3471464 [Mycena olivaceomarginata]
MTGFRAPTPIADNTDYHTVDKTTANRIDESDPKSYARYRRWRASRDYNERNRGVRNAKKRERMAALRARQKLDPPTVQAARLAAKEESARKYRERNRESLALKAAMARDNVRSQCETKNAEATLLAMCQRNRLDCALWDVEPTESDQEDPGQPAEIPRGKKLYLVCGRLVERPGVYTSWTSANAQYKNVSGATVKGFWYYKELRAAWYARCDRGEHNHPTNPLLASGEGPHDHAPPSSPPASSPPHPTCSSPPLRRSQIHHPQLLASPHPVAGPSHAFTI